MYVYIYIYYVYTVYLFALYKYDDWLLDLLWSLYVDNTYHTFMCICIYIYSTIYTYTCTYTYTYTCMCIDISYTHTHTGVRDPKPSLQTLDPPIVCFTSPNRLQTSVRPRSTCRSSLSKLEHSRRWGGSIKSKLINMCTDGYIDR